MTVNNPFVGENEEGPICRPDAPECGCLQRLGRIPVSDERDRRFAMSASPTLRRSRIWLSPGPIWDQGKTSQCVAYSTNRWLSSHPVVNQKYARHDRFYADCQRIDEFPGPPPPYDGTSVRAAFKLLQERGFVGRYTWATELEQIVRHVLEDGPVVMGTDWTEKMFEPDVNGYIWPRGRNQGGHAWLLIGVYRDRENPDGTRGAGRLINSWGPQWGQQGRAWVTFDVLERLLAGLSRWPGEACTAEEKKL